MWAALTWIGEQAVAVIRWAYVHPVAAIAIAVGALIASASLRDSAPFLSGVIDSAAGIVLAGAVAGAVTGAILEPVVTYFEGVAARARTMGPWLWERLVPPAKSWWFLYPWYP